MPYPKLIVPLAVASSATAYFGVSGAWFPDEYSRNWSSSRQITGRALTYTLLLTYLAGIFLFAATKTLEFVGELRPAFISPGAERLAEGLNRLYPARHAAATAVGVILGCFNISWAVVAGLRNEPHWLMDLSMVLGSMGVWILSSTRPSPRRVATSSIRRSPN